MANLTAVPAQIYIDPIMDTTLAALPAWFWFLLLIVVILVATNFWWIYKRIAMSPVIGYLYAFRSGTPQTMFLGKNRSFSIKYLEYIDSVLAYKKLEEISKWLVQSPKSVGRLGGLSTMMVRDNYDYSVDPIAEVAICRLAKDWNEKHSEDNPMNNYNDFERLRASGALEDEYPDGIVIPLYNIYDPSLIQKYLPSGRSAGTFGSHLTSKAREMRTDRSQEKWYEKYIPVGVASSIALVMLILAYMYSTGGL